MTTDLRERKTGDTTYLKRIDRYEYVLGRLADTPKPTYETIGKELGITRQNISRLVNRGTPKPAGRQPSNEGRIARLTVRLGQWQARRTARIVAGQPTVREDGWIADLAARIRDLG